MIAVQERRIPTRLEVELDHVRHLLKEWARWERNWKPMLGHKNESVMTQFPMVGSVSCGSVDDALEEPYMYSEAIDRTVLKAVGAAVEDLPLPKRLAVRIIYLREAIAAVFRSHRMSLQDAALLCDAAEKDLIPMLRARSVVVAGE